VLTFKAHKKAIYAVAFTPDGAQLVTSSGDQTVKLWSLDGPRELREFPGSEFVGPVAISPAGRFLARGGHGFALWNLDGGGQLLAARGYTETVAFSSDGAEFAAFGSDATLSRFAVPKLKQLPGGWGGTRSANRHTKFPAGAMAYSPDGRTIALCYGFDPGLGHGFHPQLLLWDRTTGKLRQTLDADFRFTYPTTLAFAPDGSVIAGNYGPVIGVVDVKTGAHVAAIKPGQKHFKGLAFTPDGRRLIAVNTDAAVRVYDTASWKEVTGYEWQIGKLTAVAVAPDGLRAACGSDRGRVVVWDLDT
jgi:WD40 repeat protein